MDILANTDAVALTTLQARAALNIGKTKLFDMVKKGEISTIRLGGKMLISKAEIVRILDAATSRKSA